MYRVSRSPGVLARGPWDPAEIEVSWLAHPFEPEQHEIDAADVALDALRRRGSPSHDGLAGRLAGYEVRDGKLMLELQPARWALRLISENAAGSLAAMLVVRDADGRWLAGVVGRALGARRRRGRRGRREPGRHDDP